MDSLISQCVQRCLPDRVEPRRSARCSSRRRTSPSAGRPCHCLILGLIRCGLVACWRPRRESVSGRSTPQAQLNWVRRRLKERITDAGPSSSSFCVLWQSRLANCGPAVSRRCVPGASPLQQQDYGAKRSMQTQCSRMPHCTCLLDRHRLAASDVPALRTQDSGVPLHGAVHDRRLQGVSTTRPHGLPLRESGAL
jgi:hypothetical protein